jgi:DNA-binding CsgD family transcriptional regulator
LTCVDDVLPALGRDALVRAIYGELQQWSWARFSPANASGIDQLRGALALRLGNVAAAEAHYRAGLTWAEREACPIEAGRCLLGLAAVQSRRGQEAESLASLERAGTIFQHYGAELYRKQVVERMRELGTPTRPDHRRSEPDGTRHPGGLSRREVEVLRLIAAGKTNQEIADLLVLSTSTVARHVTHIFVKTGAANRAEAASYGHRHGLL